MERMTADRNAAWAPDPLTHKNAAGDAYKRTEVVDRQIRVAVHLDWLDLETRVEVADESSPDWLSPECLVYLIRFYARSGERRWVSHLSQALLQRCARWIRNRVRSLGKDAEDEAFADVVEQLFSRILDRDSDRGDFLQVRFWVALERLAVQAYRQQLRRLERDRDAIPLEALPGHDGGDDDLRLIRTGGTAAVPATRSAESEVVDHALIREALHQLDEPLRSVFLLREYYGWPIEDKDPNVPTISSHFGKTPRTIRNWLRRADTVLEAWRGEQQ